MLKFKKTIACILTLTSSIVFADSANEKHWSLGVSALYLQPSFGGNGLGYSSFGNYAGADNQQVIRTTDGTNYIYNINPKRAWGFQLDGVYHYTPCNDLTFDWYHLDESVHGHLPHDSLFSGSIDGFYAGKIELATRWNAFNLVVGHTFHWRMTDSLNLFAGLGYAKIKNVFTNHPKLFLNSSPYFTSIDTLSYTGFGPRVGIDFNHLFGCGFSFYLKTAGSLLLGKAKQSISGYKDVVNNIYGTIPFGTNNFVSSNNNVLVPELEAKLGVNYEYQLPHHSSLDFNLGYLWMTYLRAVVAYTGIGVVGSSIGIPTTTHFDLNGTYFSVNLNIG